MNLRREFTNLSIMVKLSLPKNSKIIQGKIFGKKTKESICLNIYRWNRESGSNPRVDKFFIEKKKTGANGTRCSSIYKK